MSNIRTQLVEVGKQLARVSAQIVLTKRKVEYSTRDLELLKIQSAPVEGWPGKNEGERSVSRDKAHMANPDIIKAQNDLRLQDMALAELESVEASLSATRRSLEYVVRDGLATALGAYPDDDVDIDVVQMMAHVDVLEKSVMGDDSPASSVTAPAASDDPFPDASAPVTTTSAPTTSAPAPLREIPFPPLDYKEDKLLRDMGYSNEEIKRKVPPMVQSPAATPPTYSPPKSSKGAQPPLMSEEGTDDNIPF